MPKQKVEIKNSWKTELVQIDYGAYERITWGNTDGVTWKVFYNVVHQGSDLWCKLENAYQKHIHATDSQTPVMAEKSDEGFSDKFDMEFNNPRLERVYNKDGFAKFVVIKDDNFNVFDFVTIDHLWYLVIPDYTYGYNHYQRVSPRVINAIHALIEEQK